MSRKIPSVSVIQTRTKTGSLTRKTDKEYDTDTQCLVAKRSRKSRRVCRSDAPATETEGEIAPSAQQGGGSGISSRRISPRPANPLQTEYESTEDQEPNDDRQFARDVRIAREMTDEEERQRAEQRRVLNGSSEIERVTTPVRQQLLVEGRPWINQARTEEDTDDEIRRHTRGDDKTSTSAKRQLPMPLPKSLTTRPTHQTSDRDEKRQSGHETDGSIRSNVSQASRRSQRDWQFETMMRHLEQINRRLDSDGQPRSRQATPMPPAVPRAALPDELEDLPLREQYRAEAAIIEANSAARKRAMTSRPGGDASKTRFISQNREMDRGRDVRETRQQQTVMTAAGAPGGGGDDDCDDSDREWRRKTKERHIQDAARRQARRVSENPEAEQPLSLMSRHSNPTNQPASIEPRTSQTFMQPAMTMCPPPAQSTQLSEQRIQSEASRIALEAVRNMPTPQVIVDQIELPKFEGKDFLLFEKQFTCLCADKMWDDATKGRKLLSCLQGDTRRHVETQMTFSEMIQSLRQYYAGFRPSVEAKNMLRNFYKERHESIEEFASRIKAYADQLRLTKHDKEKYMYEAFMNGIKYDPSLQCYIEKKSPDDTNVCLAKLLKLAQDYAEKQGSTRSTKIPSFMQF